MPAAVDAVGTDKVVQQLLPQVEQHATKFRHADIVADQIIRHMQ